MAMPGFSVEGPDFLERVFRAEEITRKLQDNNWDFANVPEMFGRAAACDVLAKEILLIHDGRMQTRVGRLVMMGTGSQFNLMGPEPAISILKGTDYDILDAVNYQIGSTGLWEFDEYQKLGTPQNVEFFNFTNFYQPRDLVFWSALHDTGLFPSGFEYLLRHFAAGKIVHNNVFAPPVPSVDDNQQVIMQATGLQLQFPTSVVEWMEKPLYGGIARETMHIVTLLTTEPTKVSHPFLDMVGEGRIEYGHQVYYMRRFEGMSPKDAVRGPGVPPEGKQA